MSELTDRFLNLVSSPSRFLVIIIAMHLPAHLIRASLLIALGGQSALGSVVGISPGVSLSNKGLAWGHLPLHPSFCPAPNPPDPPIQSHGKDEFVSFEEWKKIKEEEFPPEALDHPSRNGSEPQNASDPEPVLQDEAEDVKGFGNRYNYASPDCSARIHSASPQTQHASSLLHKSRDRYMLTPCKANQHWVIIELCDEVRVEAIEIAVWEFFSGIVRDVTLSVDEDGEAKTWKQVEHFVGRHVRGVQVRISCFYADARRLHYRKPPLSIVLSDSTFLRFMVPNITALSPKSKSLV